MLFLTKSKSFKCSCGKCDKDITDELRTKLEEIDRLFISNNLPQMAITSGARCPAYNASVGGVKSSTHLSGLAVDISCNNNNNRYKMLKILIENGIKRIGVGKTFLHLDIATEPDEVIWLY